MNLEVGQIIEGKVSGIKKYGIFIAFDEHIGFCHISNISYSFVSNISELYSMGQLVKAKIINIDETNRINLSIKDISTNIETKVEHRIDNKPKNYNQHLMTNSKNYDKFSFNKKEPEKLSFDEMLSKFMKDSNEKLNGIYDKRKNKNHK